MVKKDKKEYYDLMHKNPANWKGMFYVNPKDPRIVVPKLNPSLGWTLNFGNVNAYIGLIVLILIIAAVIIFY